MSMALLASAGLLWAWLLRPRRVLPNRQAGNFQVGSGV
jgi:hypothetical protein